MNISQEARAIEARHVGWHVWWSDEGKVYAVHVWHDDIGCGVTIACHGWARADEDIAVYEHALEAEHRRRETRHELMGVAA